MPEGGCGLSLTCHAGQIGGEIVGNWFTDLVRELCRGAAELVAQSLTWWTEADQSSLLTSPAIGNVRSLIMPVAVIVLAVSVAWQGIQTIVQRRPTPLINVATGLWGYIAWTTLSSGVAVALYEAFVELSHHVLGPSIHGFGRSVGDALLHLLAQPGDHSGQVGIAFLLALFFLLVAALQWLAGIARLAGVGVLLALVPLAAAGQVTDSTRPWMLKVASWGLALLAYQPIAAVIYATSFQMVSHNQDLTALLGAAFIMLLAVVSLPALMRFFDWGGQRFSTSGGSGGGLGALAGAGMAGAGIAHYMAGSGPASGGGSGGGAGGAQIAAADTGSTVDTTAGRDSSAVSQHATGPEDSGSDNGGSNSSSSSATPNNAASSTTASTASTSTAAATGGIAAAVQGTAQAADQLRTAAGDEATQQPGGAVDPQQPSSSAENHKGR